MAYGRLRIPLITYEIALYRNLTGRHFCGGVIVLVIGHFFCLMEEKKSIHTNCVLLWLMKKSESCFWTKRSTADTIFVCFVFYRYSCFALFD